VRVSANYFETLGIQPIHGRTFAPDDEMPGQDQVVVLSHALWQERFGGRPDAVGRILRLSGRPYTITGVEPPTWTASDGLQLIVAFAEESASGRIETGVRDEDGNNRAFTFGTWQATLS
jgi:hypothetical protein